METPSFLVDKQHPYSLLNNPLRPLFFDVYVFLKEGESISFELDDKPEWERYKSINVGKLQMFLDRLTEFLELHISGLNLNHYLDFLVDGNFRKNLLNNSEPFYSEAFDLWFKDRTLIRYAVSRFSYLYAIENSNPELGLSHENAKLLQMLQDCSLPFFTVDVTPGGWDVRSIYKPDLIRFLLCHEFKFTFVHGIADEHLYGLQISFEQPVIQFLNEIEIYLPYHDLKKMADEGEFWSDLDRLLEPPVSYNMDFSAQSQTK